MMLLCSGSNRSTLEVLFPAGTRRKVLISVKFAKGGKKKPIFLIWFSVIPQSHQLTQVLSEHKGRERWDYHFW